MRAAVLVLALCFVSAEARAEITPWLSLAGGGGVERHATRGARGVGLLTATAGLGGPLGQKLVLGGLFRSTTYFGLGTELAVGPRLATAGWHHEDFALAVDLGVAWRGYEHGRFGRVPVQAGVGAGIIPWGLQVELGLRLGDVSGAPAAAGGFLAVGFDVFRFVDQVREHRGTHTFL